MQQRCCISDENKYLKNTNIGFRYIINEKSIAQYHINDGWFVYCADWHNPSLAENDYVAYFALSNRLHQYSSMNNDNNTVVCV